MPSLEQLLHQLENPSELSWKDETYDVALAGGLSAAERATYVAKLIEQAQEGDTRAILTLGHVKATEALPLGQAFPVAEIATLKGPARQLAETMIVRSGTRARPPLWSSSTRPGRRLRFRISRIRRRLRASCGPSSRMQRAHSRRPRSATRARVGSCSGAG